MKESLDAYIGTTWGHFYFAVPGVVWAGATDDLYEKTLRMRLPFAMAGAVAMVLFLWAVWPALRERPARARSFAACFFALCALSVSLVLHLREMRYYPLVVALVGVLLGAHFRFTIFRSLRGPAHAIAVGALLAALFHTFFAAYFALVMLLALDAVWFARGAPPSERRRQTLGWLAPVAVSALVVVPSAVFFETLSMAMGFTSHVGSSPSGYMENLREVLLHLARQELLLPVLALRLVHWRLRGGMRRTGPSRGDSEPAKRVADSLFLFAIGYLLIGCLNPLVYERYFVVLSPVLALVFLLDAFELAAGRTAASGADAPPRESRRMIGLAVGLVLVALSLRLTQLGGRLEELRVPYRGPVDFAIEHLRATYADPASLVVATNYAAQTYMVYLGSHVIVGISLNNIARDRRLEPDVVIPRRRWPPGSAELERFLRRAEHRAVRLPVEDRHFNNVPTVTATRAVPDPHRFRTPHSSTPSAQLVVYERVRGAESE